MKISKSFACRASRLVTVLLLLLTQGAGAQVETETLVPLDGGPSSARELERQAFEILFGLGQSNDIDLALRLLAAAADAGGAAAADRLSIAYGTGNGVAMDLDEALRLQRQAAEAGSASAQFRMGLQYLGAGMAEADIDEARRWLEAAAAQGDRRALYALSGTYLGPSYAETNMEALVPLLTRSAELGEPAALRQLGQLLLVDGDWLNPEKGIHALERAADTYPELARDIGFHYLSGRVVERNIDQAVRWLTAAEREGDLSASLWLAELLQRGLGLPRDAERAGQMREEVLLAASAAEKNSMAWSLSVSPDPFLRNGEMAVRLMESLLDSPDELSSARLDTLAAAYAEVGRFDDAVATQQRALEVLGEPADDDAAVSGQAQLDQYRERLDLYRSGRPYRSPR